MKNKLSIRRTEIQKLKVGQYLMVENEPCLIKASERSKSGKHGHAKIRIVCVGMFDSNKRSLTIPSGHMVEIPEIIKGTAQINFIEDESINIMDLETYETIEIPISEELKESIKEGDKVEYWDVEGVKLIKRKV